MPQLQLLAFFRVFAVGKSFAPVVGSNLSRLNRANGRVGNEDYMKGSHCLHPGETAVTVGSSSASGSSAPKC